MAIIYTYPTKASPANDDLILISDSADGNKTKQVKISSLPGGASGVTSVTAFTASDRGIKVSPTFGAVKVYEKKHKRIMKTGERRYILWIQELKKDMMF